MIILRCRSPCFQLYAKSPLYCDTIYIYIYIYINIYRYHYMFTSLKLYPIVSTPDTGHHVTYIESTLVTPDTGHHVTYIESTLVTSDTGHHVTFIELTMVQFTNETQCDLAAWPPLYLYISYSTLCYNTLYTPDNLLIALAAHFGHS